MLTELNFGYPKEYPDHKPDFVKQIFYVQGEEAEPFLDLINEVEAIYAINYLIEDYYHYSSTYNVVEGRTTSVNYVEKDGFRLYWSEKYRYVGLEKDFVEETNY